MKPNTRIETNVLGVDLLFTVVLHLPPGLNFTDLEKQLNDQKAQPERQDLKDWKIERHPASEHWTEPMETRRFLWGHFPHLHLTETGVRDLKEEIVRELLQDGDDNTTKLLRFVLFTSGVAVFSLELRNKKGKEQVVDVLKKTREAARFPQNSGLLTDLSPPVSVKLNSWFLRKLKAVLKFLNNKQVEDKKKIVWDEDSIQVETQGEGKWERVLQGVSVDRDGKLGAWPLVVPRPRDKNTKQTLETPFIDEDTTAYVQAPYVVIHSRSTKKQKVSQQKFRSLVSTWYPWTGMNQPAGTIAACGIEADRYTVLPNIASNLALLDIAGHCAIVADPEVAIVVNWHDSCSQDWHGLTARGKDGEWSPSGNVGRLLFRSASAMRWRMHLCILWDCKIQALFQHLRKVLGEILERLKTPEAGENKGNLLTLLEPVLKFGRV